MVKKYDKFLIEFANYISISFIPEVSCWPRELLSIWKVTSERLNYYISVLHHMTSDRIRIDLIFKLSVVTLQLVTVDILYLNVPYNFTARS